MVYVISFPSLYFGRSLNSHFHPSSSVTFTAFSSSSVPSAYRRMVIEPGRFPSWLFPSSQVLLPDMSTVSGSCLLVTVNPSDASPVISVLYPSTLTSSMVYKIFTPSLYSSSSVKDPLQLFPLFSFTVFPVSSLSASSFTTISFGRIPSWLFPSSQSFLTDTLVFPGV